MKEFFKNLDLTNTLFIIGELANLAGVVTGIINNDQSTVIWAIASTLWCAAAAVWYNRYKNGE